METFTSGDASFSAQVTNLKNAAPDAVILAAGPADAARIAVEMQRQSFKPQLFGSGGLQSAGSDFLPAGGTAIEGAILAAQFNPEPAGEEAKLIKQFQQQTRTEQTTLNAAYSYDAMYMVGDAMKQQGVTNKGSDLKADREKIKTGLATSVKDWVGMGGPTTLQEDGEVQRIPQVATVTGGKMIITPVK